MTVTEEVIETKLEDEFYVGEEGSDDDADDEPPTRAFSEGKEVANGSHVVPAAVAVEELKNYGGHKNLKNKCPDDVRKLLTEKNLFDVYDRFVQSIYDTKTTRGKGLGSWKDQQFVSVLDLFRDDFTAGGVRVALCKRKSGKGTRRWLEFIDVDALEEEYVPQFDVSNWSGQVIKTVYHKLKFPNGVVVEELKSWGGREKLKEKIPIHVEMMINKHGLMPEYEQMVDHVVEAGVGNKIKSWKIEKLKDLIQVYKPMFAEKGVDLFVCHKQEWVSHGQHGGHMEHFRWIEFVDRAEQPTYVPQRDAETKSEDACSIM